MRTMMTMIAMLVFTAACAEAHDIYSELMGRLGESCCNETDCRPANYRVTAAGVEMLLDDEWVRVPNEVIQYRTLHGDTGETHGGHWCGTMYHSFEKLHPDSRRRLRARQQGTRRAGRHPFHTPANWARTYRSVRRFLFIGRIASQPERPQPLSLFARRL